MLFMQLIVKKATMEKRVIGVVLTILGIMGLIMGAYYFINHTGNLYNIKLICVFGILGIIFFIAGIGLVSGTKDVIRKNERVS
jgi:uncharacterized membrane protein